MFHGDTWAPSSTAFSSASLMKMGILASFPRRLRPLVLQRWYSGSSSSGGRSLVKSAAQTPAATVAPMNKAVFRQVFAPASRARYKHLYRWDWHLRMLLYALMPPAAAYAYVRFLEWYMAGEVAAYREMVMADKAAKSVEVVKDEAKSLEQRVMHLESYLRILEDRREREDIVDKAKLVLKQQRQAAANAAIKNNSDAPLVNQPKPN